MQRERWAQVQVVFDAAVAIEPRDRVAYLDRICAGDVELRQEVDSLLHAKEETAGFLEKPAWSDIDRKACSVLLPGDRVHHYEVVSVLGAGGMGEVYLAIDTRLQRQVALKILPPTPSFLRQRLRRFEQEARAASALSHPNVCVIYDIGETGAGDHYIAMEHVPGVTLRERLSRGAIPIDEALEITLQVASALSAAHKAGVIHRDIKPENIMIRFDGSAKVLDFGIAKFLGPNRRPDLATSESGLSLTQPGMVIGTAKYMAPEQARGSAVDARTDLWSLGVVLREMLTGSAPFGGLSGSDVIASILLAEPPTLPRMPGICPQLEKLDKRLLAKDPEARHQSADELIRDLKGLQSILAQSELATTSQWQAVRNLRSFRKLFVLAAVLIVLATITGTLFYRRSGRAVHPVSLKPVVNEDKRRIVALLPFENISHQPSEEYFSAGITEEISGQLSKLASLQLISPAAVARYKDPRANLRQIVSELGVGSVVLGSVRQDAERVRVNVELIDTRSEQTIWSEQYDRDLKDVFAVQSDIAVRIAKTLGATLSRSEQERIEKRPTENMAAYQLYLQAQDLSLGVSKENLQAIQKLQDALAMDPRFALALAHLAYRQTYQGYLGDQHAVEVGIESARRALAIDPDLAEAHFVLGTAYWLKGQIGRARWSFLRTLELKPNYVEGMNNRSLLELDSGRLDEALYWAARALRVTPNSGNSYYHLCVPLLALGDDATTGSWLAEGEQHHPRDIRVQIIHSIFQSVSGKRTEGLERARKAAEIEPENEEPQVLLADLTFLAGEKDAEGRLQRLVRIQSDSAGMLLPETTRLKYAYLLLRRGDTDTAMRMIEEAEQSARKAIAEGNEAFYSRLELAAVYSLRGNQQTALNWLEQAYEAGARDYRAIQVDPLFEKVRSDSRFKEIIHKMESDVAQMRERAKEQLPDIFAAQNRAVWRSPEHVARVHAQSSIPYETTAQVHDQIRKRRWMCGESCPRVRTMRSAAMTGWACMWMVRTCRRRPKTSL